MANVVGLVDVLSDFDDPAMVSREFTRVAATQLEPWYHDTVFLDAEVNALWSRARNGSGDSEKSPRSVSLLDALAAGRVDPVVSGAFARCLNLPDPPPAVL